MINTIDCINFLMGISNLHGVIKKKNENTIHKTRLQRTFCVEGRDKGLWSGILRAETNVTDAT